MSYAHYETGVLPAFRRTPSPLRHGVPISLQYQAKIPIHNAVPRRVVDQETVHYASEHAPPPRLTSIFEAPEFPPSDLVEPATQTDGFTDFLIHIEERQDALRDAREALLGSRYRLQVQRRELRNTRDKAASQAGATFNRIRKYLLNLDLDLPAEIDAALSEADISRDDLGIHELEYEEAERAYNLEEWRYTEKETKFVDDFSGSAPVASQRSGLFPLPDEDDNMLRYSNGPQDIANLVAEADGEILPSDDFEDDVSVYSTDDGSEESSGQSTISGEPSTPMGFESVYSHESTVPKYSPEIAQRGPQADDGIVIGHYRLKWAGTLRYINEWLLNNLKSSKLEKGRLRASLPLDDIQKAEWWSLVVRHWATRNPDGTAYHTGDTTVSDDTLSEPVSSTAMRRLFDTSSTAESAMQPISTLNLLPQEPGEFLELASFPKRIKRRDLIDRNSERSIPNDSKNHVKFLIRSSSDHSEVTQPNILMISDIEEKSSWSSSGEEETVLHADEYSNGGSIVGAQHEDTPSRRPLYTLPEEPVKMDHSTQTQPLSPLLGFVNDDAVREDGSHSPEASNSSPPGTTESKVYLSDSDSPESMPNEPYIKVDSPAPWNLPILRLTPLPTPTASDTVRLQYFNRLEDIPFVNISDSPYRLPGPSKLPGVFSHQPFDRSIEFSH